jgi:nitrogen fixation/metabolism regulation signal transduction histidine kinase
MRGGKRGDSLGEVILEVNALGEILKGQRLDAVEATALLRTVMAEIVDVAVFAFDQEQKLRLVNRAGERLLGQPASRLLGRGAAELNLADCLTGETARTLQMTFPGGSGRWGMRRSHFREGGLPHQLLVLTDMSRALREEERQAWQRLVRVLGHELNNSLAPIKSLAGSLENLLRRESPPPDWKDDMQRGLAVISGRAEALSRFTEAYTRLARLPQPRLRPLSIGAWVRRVAGLENRIQVTVAPGPELSIQADGDQLEQLLINLVRNAVEALLDVQTSGSKPKIENGQPPSEIMTPGARIGAPVPIAARPELAPNAGVRVGWAKAGSYLEVWVEDDGPGLSNTANLFVPFFTTKRGGSGIGLVLCRQIAEAHGGSLTLENRPDARGCLARLRLPLN